MLLRPSERAAGEEVRTELRRGRTGRMPLVVLGKEEAPALCDLCCCCCCCWCWEEEVGRG